MAGTRGPVPKRSDRRIRRNKENGTVEKIPVIGPVEVPDLGFDDPHPIVEDLYRSLTESAQSKYYEPSDWQYARLALHFADQLLKSPKPNGQILSVVNQMFTSLLVSEGDRRRVQLEIERNEANGVVVDVAQMFRDRLTQS